MIGEISPWWVQELAHIHIYLDSASKDFFGMQLMSTTALARSTSFYR